MTSKPSPFGCSFDQSWSFTANDLSDQRPLQWSNEHRRPSMGQYWTYSQFYTLFDSSNEFKEDFFLLLLSLRSDQSPFTVEGLILGLKGVQYWVWDNYFYIIRVCVPRWRVERCCFMKFWMLVLWQSKLAYGYTIIWRTWGGKGPWLNYQIEII